MFKLRLILRYIVSFFLILFITSCGSDEDTTPATRLNGNISGYVYDAPISGAIVNIWEFENGKIGRKLGSTITRSDGYYSIDIGASSMPLFIESKGGAYRDPMTNNIVDSSNSKSLEMSSVINYTESVNRQVMITPLTYQISGLVEYYVSRGLVIESAIQNAESIYMNMYGFNVTSTIPIDITTGGQSSITTFGHQYGALLTAFSVYSFDLIQQYPGAESNQLYTSYHLADIAYRDIVADGLLNGKEIDSSGLSKDMAFGQVYVTSELYSSGLAKYILISVSDSSINVSGTDVSDYMTLVNRVNQFGTNSSSFGVIPPRLSTELDSAAPLISRQDTSVLTGNDSVNINLMDDTGVDGYDVSLEWKMTSEDALYWKELEVCSANVVGKYCHLDPALFIQGARNTFITVNVSTAELDLLDPDLEDAEFVEARLVVNAEDTLGNHHNDEDKVGILFEWENIAPVIDIISADAITSSTAEYTFEGIIKKHPDDIKSIEVKLGSQKPTLLDCIPINDGANTWCKFQQSYITDSFGDSTLFNVFAEDVLGNIGNESFTVYKDNLIPDAAVSYPSDASPAHEMYFYTYGDYGEASLGSFSNYTYTEANVGTTAQILEVDFSFASQGLKNLLPNVDFGNFDINYLSSNYIPYIKLRISDPKMEGEYGSSADKLTLRVEYYRKRLGDSEYSYITATESRASTNSIEAKIPHETLIKEDDGHVAEVSYYIPFTKDVLGTTFTTTTSEFAQKLRVTVIDPAGNKSNPLEVFFRSEFNLPRLKVVTPFIGSIVRLEGMKSNNDFSTIRSCLTEKSSNQLDVAGCEVTYNPLGYSFFRVTLESQLTTHYYQWENNSAAKKDISFTYNTNSYATLGSYFSIAENMIIYIDELSVYQTALFEHYWHSLSSVGQTIEKAKSLLVDVNSALSTQDYSFFGFEPSRTEYASNIMLGSTIPEYPGDSYQHRFLVESFDQMADGNQSSIDSLDYAKAIYDDLYSDAKADGIGEKGEILVGNEQLTEDTYRSILADNYFNLAAHHYGVLNTTALEQAEHFLDANPTVEGTKVFSDPSVEHFDNEAPTYTAEPDNYHPSGGSATATATPDVYDIMGKVKSTIALNDDTGIGTGLKAPKFNVYWYTNFSTTRRETNIAFILTAGSNEYNQTYTFEVDSLSLEYSNLDRFEVYLEVEDIVGNSTGEQLVLTYRENNP